MEKQNSTGEVGDIEHNFPGDVIDELDGDRIIVPSSITELVHGGPINSRQVRVCLLLRSVYAVFDVLQANTEPTLEWVPGFDREFVSFLFSLTRVFRLSIWQTAPARLLNGAARKGCFGCSPGRWPGSFLWSVYSVDGERWRFG